MAPGTTPPVSSDAPPYTPTHLISPPFVFAPPYTETATQDPTATNEAATADPAIANETPKPRRRRREGCPLSSHAWVLWSLWLYCSALFSFEIAELIYWDSWPVEHKRLRHRLQFKSALAFTYLNAIITGLALGTYLPLMLWKHYFVHYPGKYEVPWIFVDNCFAAYFVGVAPLRVDEYLWFSIPLILLFAYSGFLRGLRYKKSRDGALRDPAANAQMSEIMGRRNGIVGGNAGNTEYQ
ncbi:hypothetical protein MMC31_004149 [Peltigera leucophlebia]|nr:hypothetical protein [Peltigera leucophlebia]